MSQRGRKSAAAQSVGNQNGEQQTGEVISINSRPSPPERLTEEQAEIWKEIVNALRDDWFSTENLALLEQYVAHVDQARKLKAQIDKGWELNDDHFNRQEALLKAHERTGRAISSLATRMRFTQQSTYDREKTKGGKGQRAPWAK